ncbi:MAG: tRNA pseudouridine(38-40) synthase TruA [Planctomycetota bacterium]|jgi:tRNA pseudouridine38-40 synthase
MNPRYIKLTIQYDGSEYHGWQVQPGKRTVQDELNKAVSALVGDPITVHGASRTDAGVSALGQTAVFEIKSPIPTGNLARAISDKLPKDIVVTQAVEVPAGFDVISGPKSKLYRYVICTSKCRPVLHLRQCWHVPHQLDIQAMQAAGQLLVGKKDFKSFASAADKRTTSVRTIFRCDVTTDGDWTYVEVEGDGFLYNMVRNIVGTLVEVGIGRMKTEKIEEILNAKDRRAAGPIAPPSGLCLMWIKY